MGESAGRPVLRNGSETTSCGLEHMQPQSSAAHLFWASYQSRWLWEAAAGAGVTWPGAILETGHTSQNHTGIETLKTATGWFCSLALSLDRRSLQPSLSTATLTTRNGSNPMEFTASAKYCNHCDVNLISNLWTWLQQI